MRFGGHIGILVKVDYKSELPYRITFDASYSVVYGFGYVEVLTMDEAVKFYPKEVNKHGN